MMEVLLGDVDAYGPILFVLIAGVAVTAGWRLTAVLVGTRLAADHPVFEWARAVAAAIVAAQSAILVAEPMGAVADVSLWLRVAAVLCGFLAYHFNGRNVLLGVVVGDVVVLAAIFLG
jgi:hypothetical protein